MLNKKSLYLLLLFAGAAYFYYKQETTGLIIICLFTLFLLFFFGNKLEHQSNVSGETEANVSGETEAIQILASAYANGTLKVTNMHVTHNLTVDGDSTLGAVGSGNATVGNDFTVIGNSNQGYTTTLGNLAVTGASTHNQGLTVGTGNLTVSNGNIRLPTTGQGIVFDQGSIASDGQNLNVFRNSDGQAMAISNYSGLSWDAPQGRAGYYNAGRVTANWQQGKYV